jgi:hypothetical protein
MFVVDQYPVGALGPDTAHEAFRERVRPGVRGGVFTTSMPSAANTVSNDAVNWRRGRGSGTGTCHTVTEVQHQVAGLLGSPDGGRMGGDAEDVHPSGRDLHNEQHIQPPQRDGVDVEVVGRQQAGRLRAQERPPIGVDLAWGRTALRAGEDATDGASADPMAEPDEFALDAPVPQPGFSLARRRIRSRRSSLIGGRPGRFG